MIKRPELRVSQALSRLKHDQDFMIFSEYLQEALDDQDIKNRTLPGGDQLGRGQGSSLTLAELLNQINNAAEFVNRSR